MAFSVVTRGGGAYALPPDAGLGTEELRQHGAFTLWGGQHSESLDLLPPDVLIGSTPERRRAHREGGGELSLGLDELA